MNQHLRADAFLLRVGAWTLFALLALPVSASTVYVAPSGNDANPGTPAAPFATLAKGVKAAGSNGEVRAAVGLYEASFVLSGGVRVRGGFRPPTWSTPSPIPDSLWEARTLPSGTVNATVLFGPSSPSVLVPAHASGALENVIVVGPKLATSRPGTGASIAVAVGRSGDLSLDRVKVFAGVGAPGLRGTDGAAGSGICSAGGQGGTSEERHVDDTYCESHAGTAGSTVQGGGSGGAGGNAGSTKCKDNIGAGQVGSGASGSPGMVGPSGTAPDVPPVDWGAFGWPALEVHWSMGRLPASGNGGPGGGGGGGGAGGSKFQAWYWCDAEILLGTPGAPGGEGGCGGHGAEAGGTGGGSFGVVAGPSSRLAYDMLFIEQGVGGVGGAGGNGGAGSPGKSAPWRPAQPRKNTCLANHFTPGRGGDGGRGGNGGFGGGGLGGDGGPSVGIVIDHSADATRAGVLSVGGGRGGKGGTGGKSGSVASPVGRAGAVSAEVILKP